MWSKQFTSTISADEYVQNACSGRSVSSLKTVTCSIVYLSLSQTEKKLSTMHITPRKSSHDNESSETFHEAEREKGVVNYYYLK